MTQLKFLVPHLPVLEQFEKQKATGWHTCLDMLGAAVRRPNHVRFTLSVTPRTSALISPTS